MRRIYKILVVGLVLSCGLISFLPTPAFACKPHEIAEYRGMTASCVAKCDPSEVYVTIPTDGSRQCVAQQDAIFTWVTSIIRFLSAGVGIAVVGGIVWGGILYATARDNQAQTKKAIAVITNSVIGLILFILLFAIINFLVPGGILT